MVLVTGQLLRWMCAMELPAVPRLVLCHQLPCAGDTAATTAAVN